jgi:phage terminase large subunit-like protein
MPSRESSYRNLVLNQRVDQTSPFVPRAIWLRNGADPVEAAFYENPVYIGLDLSARNDLTAMVAVARDTSGAWHIRPTFFAPSLGLTDRASRDRAPYDVWRDRGHLVATPGASVDYAVVAEQLCQLCDDWDVAAIAFDRWRMDVFKTELSRLGRELPLVEFGQGYRDMAPALDALEGELMAERIHHGGHPVLTWCAANAVATRDAAGNRKLDKAKATGRIDGMVALAMAIGACAKAAPKLDGPSVYEERGILTI